MFVLVLEVVLIPELFFKLPHSFIHIVDEHGCNGSFLDNFDYDGFTTSSHGTWDQDVVVDDNVIVLKDLVDGAVEENLIVDDRVHMHLFYQNCVDLE